MSLKNLTLGYKIKPNKISKLKEIGFIEDGDELWCDIDSGRVTVDVNDCLLYFNSDDKGCFFEFVLKLKSVDILDDEAYDQIRKLTSSYAETNNLSISEHSLIYDFVETRAGEILDILTKEYIKETALSDFCLRTDKHFTTSVDDVYENIKDIILRELQPRKIKEERICYIPVDENGEILTKSKTYWE